MNPDEILSTTEHRPYPRPKGPWMMRQTWHDLLFAHWAMDPEDVKAAMPAELRPYLDIYDGQAWVGVVPFWMSNVRARWTPPVPTAATFPELNVRTYVTISRKPGVYFFSLDAASLLAVVGARAGFALEYFWATMQCDVAGDTVKYSSQRIHRQKPADFAGEYSPAGSPQLSAAGSLEHFLTERYCLYAVRAGFISRANIHHLPWPLRRASADITKNSMALASGIRLPETKPLLHFAKKMEVLVWLPERAERE